MYNFIFDYSGEKNHKVDNIDIEITFIYKWKSLKTWHSLI